MRSTMRKNVLSILLVTLPALVAILVFADQEPQPTDDATSALSTSFTTANCEGPPKQPSVLSCPDPDHLKMSYVSRGSVECGGALTLEQAAISPSIRADRSIVEPEALYSLVLIDTTITTVSTNTFFTFDSVHPILHYGAVNIQGSTLLEGLSLDRTDKVDVFSPYQGPSPPEPDSMWAAEGVEFTLFAYEYMLAAQPQDIVVPKLDSNRNFDYESFFDETVGVGFSNLASTTHFVSGWCVKEIPAVSGRQDPTQMPTQPKVPTEAPTEAKIPTDAPTNAEDPFEPTTETRTPSEILTAVASDLPISTTMLTAEEAGSTDEINGTDGEKSQEPTTEASGGARTTMSPRTAAICTKGLAFIGLGVTIWL